MFFGLFIFSGAVVSAQQIYIENQGRPPRPNCNIPAPTATAEPFAFTAGGEPPLYHFSPFSYTLTETVRIASPVTPSPLPQYGPRYTAVSHLLPNISTTSWGNWDPTAVPTAVDTADRYGQDAYSSLWKAMNLQNFTRGLYTTTVSPTPVPTSELILPPPLYFGPHDCYSFPEDFMLGVSGAAAQIEGAVADEGRSPAVTDLLGDLGQSLGLPDVTDNDYTTVENYYLYKQDIERLAAMGMRYYSFSIPWTRILPFSVPGSPVNSQALEHYNDLINFAIEKGIQPIVTLIHFDTPALFVGNNPAALAERAYIGRVNYAFQNETFEDAFVNYGKIVMSHFADRVPIWITFNEAQFGSISGPGVDHVLKSHARLYHFYKEELHGKGKVSMKMGATPGIPLSPSNSSHRAAAQHYTDLNLGTYLNPLVLGQDYPEVYKMTVQDYVPLTNQDLGYLNGTLDFVAVDAYTAATVYPIVDIATCAANNASSNTLYPNCVGSTQETVNGWNIGYHSTYTSYTTPTYLRTQLNYLWNTFKVPVMITEFGLATSSSSPTSQQLNDIRFDVERSEYYISYLNEVLKSIWEDGVHVMGAIMWSWIDNWEFGTFSHQFGLQYVNRSTQERTYRRSFFDVVDFVETRRMEQNGHYHS